MSMTMIRNAAGTTFGRISTIYRRRRTTRILNGLPEEIRRDIGWTGDGRMS